MRLKVTCDENSKLLIFQYTCNKNEGRSVPLIYATLVVQKMRLVLVIFDTFEL